MSQKKTPITDEQTIHNLSELDLSDPKTLDGIALDSATMRNGFIIALITSLIAIFVFFIPINNNILFGMIYQKLIVLVNKLLVINGESVGALFIVTIALCATGIASVIGKYFAPKESKLYKYFEADSIFHPIFYLMGSVFISLYFLDKIGVITGPEMIVGPSTGEMVIPGVVVGVAFIIPVGAVFVPFLIDYGCIDFFGVLLEPLMRPLFKTPGKSAVDACASFVGSTTMGIIITSRLFKGNAYTKKEAAIICTCFSAVSVGYALLVMQTAGIGDHFVVTYFTCFFLVFVMAAVMSRIQPLKGKLDEYYNGRIQTEIERKEQNVSFGIEMFRLGATRAAKRAHIAGSIPKKIMHSVVDSFPVLPKVITLLCSFGILGMVIAKYTPVFNIIGYAFYPLTQILGVPDAMVAAAAIPTGVTEMFIPVLTIADQVATLHIKTRFFVVVVSMLQIIFLAESVVVITNTGLPVSFKELMVIFLQRTILAMPLAAIFMHLLF